MLTVLIVDDEPINQDILLEYLADSGYALETVDDGAAAWAALEGTPEKYDIVLLDRVMPHLDGMDVLRRMKAHATLRYVPVILQTARAAVEEISEGIDAGAYYYLTKPYDERVLRSVVATAGEERARHVALVEAGRRTALASSMAESARFVLRNLEQAHALAVFLANACPTPEARVTGFSELLINAIEHGNLAIGYDEKSVLKADGTWSEEVARRLADPRYAGKRVVVDFRRERDCVEVVIRDQGPGFDWQCYLDFDPTRAMDNHGRGIAMSRLLSFDELEYRGCGNEVMVRVRLDAAQQAA